tara:strand:- start:1729 stop:1974 length:246 start_codon:yes stop_codon:yes gene_type:complete
MGVGLFMGISHVSLGHMTHSEAAIADYFFELSSGDLQPRDSITDANSIWDLDGNGDIMPADAPTDEGYFQVDGNGDIEPIS